MKSPPRPARPHERPARLQERPAGSRFPLARPTAVARLPQGQDAVAVAATPEECAALATLFGIPAIRDLVGRFAVAGPTERLVVTGLVEAVVTQVCTVSLEPFEAPVREPVEVTFSDLDPPEDAGEDDPEGTEAPDPILDGRVDFGALTAEFLALGLDPYPRRPGIAFEPVASGPEAGPFDALRRLRGDA